MMPYSNIQIYKVNDYFRLFLQENPFAFPLKVSIETRFYCASQNFIDEAKILFFTVSSRSNHGGTSEKRESERR